MRRHLTYANVAATLALVLAMSGGALAAKHYLVSSTKQLSPKVLKAFEEKDKSVFKKLAKTVVVTKATSAATAGTAALATNAGNATNATNAANAGNAGQLGGVGPGGYAPSVLGKGKTETGYYAGWGTGKGYVGDAVTYRIPLAAPLDAGHVHFITGAPTTECPGKANEPKAASGNLCVYQTSVGETAFGAIFPQTSGSGTGSDADGFGIWFTGEGTAGVWDYGSWAVTG